MYIGPWQEYKLARLIQNQHQALAREVAQEVIRQRTGRPNSSRGALTSPTSSQRSGFSGISTQSAPAQLPQPSAQVRLNDYCDSAERASLASDRRRRWAPPRPGAASSSSTGSTRPYSSSSAGSASGSRGLSASLSGIPAAPQAGTSAIKRKAGRVGGGAKKSGKPPQAASFEEQRRARIRHMQKLYGLGDDSEAAAREEPSHPVETAAAAATAAAGSCMAAAASTAMSGRGQDDRTSDVDSAISRLQSSILAHESADATTKRSGDDWPLPSLPEDPLGASMDMGGSGGLIEWSKNLQPDDLSPQATLASFFPT
eukprot:TRINITY_DN17289_c0_g1_i2.p1 TRINITY_DN17289_c0_g1~~TRINITY_DN17289_c0_g1_i2.p1  ORF type:complete len:314 (-),score=59.94 TRINITY_DN17289_c0_g1_i2:66-1007(-)